MVHELPRRIRLKGGLFRHPRLNTDHLEAHLASLPGVDRVRANPYAGSLVVRHDGLPGRTGDILAALGALPPVVFVKGPARPREISRMDIGLHLLAAVASFAVPPVVRLVLAVLVGLPVVVDGVKNLLSRGVTAKSLDAASVGLCLAVGNSPSVCAIALMRIFGDYLKQTNDKRSNDLLHSLLRLKQQAVWVEREGVEIEVAPGDVAVGDVVVCGPGELVAVDGEVLAGAALVDKSMITGESIPVSLEKGDEVISGSVVESGSYRAQCPSLRPLPGVQLVQNCFAAPGQDRGRHPASQGLGLVPGARGRLAHHALSGHVRDHACKRHGVAVDDRPGRDRHLAAAVQAAQKPAFGEDRVAGVRMVQKGHQPGGFRIAYPVFDAKRALPGGRQKIRRRQRDASRRGQPQAVQARPGHDDGREFPA
ncbi:hypothetical protein G3N56_17155 [Desulfovibrio sulfodismutans]|uniref:P-type ATPase A domain-containing protein n=1 Tax=Desulfolutivibrio sulfodismutans TaxID=63561 RepID=A0A7K3NQH8_9BACT|nr:hypothetical protein [Desulfolutivibrio sulfodismutans]QLA13868.1 hypothetical protein GD606_17175 [Desulfolutivibrio sulfodismutans DSM 3696]